MMNKVVEGFEDVGKVGQLGQIGQLEGDSVIIEVASEGRGTSGTLQNCIVLSKSRNYNITN